MDDRGENVVARLSQIDMIIRMNRFVNPLLAPQNHIGSIGDDLVGIHVGGGSGARLKDIENKLVVPSPLHDLLGGLLNGSCLPSFQKPKLKVCPRGSKLDEAKGINHFPPESPATDRKIFNRPLGLGPVVSPSWDPDRPHGVFLYSVCICSRHISPQPFYSPHPCLPAGPGPSMVRGRQAFPLAIGKRIKVKGKIILLKMNRIINLLISLTNKRSFVYHFLERNSMGKNLVQKIFESHRVSGTLKPQEDIAISIDQTLTQDATGTMACLQFEALGIPKVRTRLSVSYVDHNMLQTGFENADDHRFLQTFAAKYGILFSKPGNGICHQVHLERFAKPGETLLGADSHTPNAGAMGMIAIGAGGLDVAVAMAGGAYHLKMPEVVLVKLKGKLPPWVASKDIVLELLRRITVKGGVGKIFEFGGTGVKGLSVPERATIANLGAELGATTTVFPSDERTLEFLRAQGRKRDWIPLEPDPDAGYDQVIEIDLHALKPLIAQPSSPDNVCPVKEVAGKEVRQVCIGSCNNSSYMDLRGVAKILKGKRVHPEVSLTVTPGSKQVYQMIARNGALSELISAGARILESACGPCIGMGQAPPSHAISIRTMNRNFPGRSGTPEDQVYLASPYVAAASALKGVITDPRTLGPRPPRIRMPKRFLIDDSMIVPPSSKPEKVVIERGPNIRPLPVRGPLEDFLEGSVLLKVGDHITTDHILPAGAKILPLRSNIPAISEYVFERIDPGFAKRAKEMGGGFILGGENYGQGSSREHAAMAPMYLGIKAIVAKSYARIHRANLINFGILPLIFGEANEFEEIEIGDWLQINSLRGSLRVNGFLKIENTTQQRTFEVAHGLNQREIDILLAGGLLNYTKEHP